MKTKLLALLAFLGISSLASARVFVGVGVGVGGGYYYAPPPPAPVVAYAPGPYVRPGFTWVGGYWYPAGPHYAWRDGYWARPPYNGAYWVGPRYYGHRYYRGYWHR